MKLTLKMARVKANLKQGVVAEKLGISREYLNRVEAGKVVPKVTLAFALAHLYSISIEDIDFLCS